MTDATTTTPRYRITVEEAAELITACMPAYPAERASLEAARGAILRQQVVAERDQPPFDRVTMDGIAIRFAAIANGMREFTVKGIQAAGVPEIELGADDYCVEIMTGAMLPHDADTIVPVERLSRRGDHVTLEAGYSPVAGQFVHRRASDHAVGQPLLEPGTVIDSPEMAVLTIAGQAKVQVARWPRIAVVSTGDELVDVGEPIADFQIRSSNDRAIAAALEKRGCRSIVRASLPDNPEQLLEAIGRLHGDNDVLILSGGVSMGKYDYVPQIMEKLGVRLVLHKILQKPGLPMWFGVAANDHPVFALPGNPVSSLVCLIRYVLPAILHGMGAAEKAPPRVRLAEPIHFPPDLTCFMPVILQCSTDGELTAVPKPTNTSGDFVALAGTHGIVELPRGRDDFPAGYAADYYAW